MLRAAVANLLDFGCGLRQTSFFEQSKRYVPGADAFRGFHQLPQFPADLLSSLSRIQLFERSQALTEAPDGDTEIVYSLLIGPDHSLADLVSEPAQECRGMRSYVIPESQWRFLRLLYRVVGRKRAIECREDCMSDTQKEQPKPKKAPAPGEDKTYDEPRPILDPSCGFEQVDRGEGMGVDDEKTYHRTEK